MMHQSLALVAIIGTLLAESSLGFSTSAIQKRTFVSSSSTTSLDISSSLEPIFAEEEARHRMDRARECAFSDTCELQEVRDHLQDILTIQSGCVSGVIAGSDLCENQDAAAEIVAHLREKLGSASFASKSSSVTAQEATSVMASGFMSTAVLALFFIVISTMRLNTSDATPFTGDEWWWAAKDGYLDDMIGHYLRNGGL